MMKLFLQARHWQLFILMFAIFTLFHIVSMHIMLSNITAPATYDESIVSFMNYSPLLTVVALLILLGWIWSIAVGLQTKVPPIAKMKINRFKIFFFCPLLYMLGLYAFVLYTVDHRIENIITTLALVIPLHFFSMFCLLHNFYFAAKTLKTVELQREVVFSDFAAEFFLLLFYPAGIWIIQPRLNALSKS